MKHKLTKIICFILISSCLLACASCKKCKKDAETTPGDPLLLEIPTISTPDATFLKINDFNVTANQAYHQLLNSYGVDMMMNIIDDDLLPNNYSEEGFEEYLNKIIYQDEEPSEELLNKFLDELTLYCLSKNENDVNYYKSFYRIRYKRYVYAKNCYINNLSSDYFSKARKESEFNNKYPKENDLIIIKFTSATEAKSFMTKYDINTTREKWQSIDGSKIYTNEEVLAKVVKANKVNYMAIPPLELGEELSCTAKIRYGHKGSPCVIKRTGEDEITCTFPDGVRAPTPGQAVVFYVDGCVGGGGTITEAER